MEISVVAAYAEGRIAGARHALALHNDPVAKPPSSPYSGAAYLAGVEWERGFSDGFAQGLRRAARARNSAR